MVIQQSAKDAVVLATFVLVLMIQLKGVTGENRRRSRDTSGDDDLLELETSREPFGNDEELVADSLQRELRGSQNEDVDSRNRDIQWDLAELEPELQEDQLLAEREGGARAERTEMETQDNQQLQLEQYTDKENNEDDSHTQRESKKSVQLQQQQQLPKEKIGQDKGKRALMKMEESRQLQKGQPMNEEKGEIRPQRAQQDKKEDQQSQKKLSNEENGTLKFRRAGVDSKDKQQLQQEQLTSAEKNPVVLQHALPVTKGDQKLQLPNGIKDTRVERNRLQTRENHELHQDTLLRQQLTSPERNTVLFQHAQPDAKEVQQLQQGQLPNVMKGDTKVSHGRLETRDSHKLQQELLSKEDNKEIRAQDTPVEMEKTNRQRPHVHMSNGEKDGGRVQRDQVESKQKWDLQGQQLLDEEKTGKLLRNVRSETNENHQKNEEKGGVEGYLGKLEAGDILQGYQNQFGNVQTASMGTQHGQLEVKDVQQQLVGKDTVSNQLDVEQQQLRQLAALGQIAESVRRNQEAGKRLEQDEMPGVWMKSGNMDNSGPLSVDRLHPNENNDVANSGHVELPVSERIATSKQLETDEMPSVWMQNRSMGKLATFAHNEPSSVEKLHPNENTELANSGHMELPGSERLPTSEQHFQSEVPAAMQADIQMPPRGNAESVLMHEVPVGEDETHPREHTGIIDSTGWQHPTKVGELGAGLSDIHHGAEPPSGTAETNQMHDVRVSNDEIHPREHIGGFDSMGWQQPSKMGETEARVGDTHQGAEPHSGTAETDQMHDVRVGDDDTHLREHMGRIDSIGWQQPTKVGATPLSASGTSETGMMHDVHVGEDEIHPREHIGTIDSMGWQQPNKVEETEARISDAHEGAEHPSGTAETGMMHDVHVGEDEVHPREHIDTIDRMGWQQATKVGETGAKISVANHEVESPSDTAETQLMLDTHVDDDETHPREHIGTIDSMSWQQPSKVGELDPRVSDTHNRDEQWPQTAGRISPVNAPALDYRDRATGVQMRHRPEDVRQSGVGRHHWRKLASGSHHAHMEMGKMKKRMWNKAGSLEQLRARRRNKAAATPATRAQRQKLHKALPRPQRQEDSPQDDPGDALGIALAASLAGSEPPADESVAVELATVTVPSVGGEPVGRIAVVLVSSPQEEATVDLSPIPATVPSLEVDMDTSTTISVIISVNTNTSETTTAEPLTSTSELDVVALRVVQGVQRRAQQSERMRQHILPALRPSQSPAEAEAGAAKAGGAPSAACNTTGPEETVECKRRRLVDRALRALQQLQGLEERGRPCPAPLPQERECLSKLLQYAPAPAAGHGELSRRIRHLRRLVADYEKLTAAEKSQVQGVRDYLARQLSRLYSLTQASTLPPPHTREVAEPQQQQQPEARVHVVQARLEGQEAAAAALLGRLQRHSQLPPRPDAVQRRLKRRLASRHRRDAYAQLAVSAADARFHMPPA